MTTEETVLVNRGCGLGMVDGRSMCSVWLAWREVEKAELDDEAKSCLCQAGELAPEQRDRLRVARHMWRPVTSVACSSRLLPERGPVTWLVPAFKSAWKLSKKVGVTSRLSATDCAAGVRSLALLLPRIKFWRVRR
jgi:hypothetical protein